MHTENSKTNEPNRFKLLSVILKTLTKKWHWLN